MKKSTERRRSSRIRKSAQVHLSVWRDGESKPDAVKAAIVDLSPRGLGILSPVAIEPGAYFVIISGKSRLLYSVVRCWPQENSFRVGAEFSLRLGKDTSVSHVVQIRRLMSA